MIRWFLKDEALMTCRDKTHYQDLCLFVALPIIYKFIYSKQQSCAQMISKEVLLLICSSPFRICSAFWFSMMSLSHANDTRLFSSHGSFIVLGTQKHVPTLTKVPINVSHLLLDNYDAIKVTVNMSHEPIFVYYKRHFSQKDF